MSIITISTIFFAVMILSLGLSAYALVLMFGMRNDNTYADENPILLRKGRE